MKLYKSPFKTDQIEDDPNSFALRPAEIQFCASKLFNNHNVLITGPRGIGKTSLSKQLQLFYQDENILLKRCGIDASFPKYLCAFYKCDKTSTLQNMALDILQNIEQECLLVKRFEIDKKKKVTFEFNIGIFKAAIENEFTASSPASIATHFVNGLRELYHGANLLGRDGICVLFDEIDMVSEDINIADFLRLIHEYGDHYKIKNLVMIFTGQLGTYTRLLNENPSIERMVFHTPLTKLEYEESIHILTYASQNAQKKFFIEDDARDTILKIAAGYPYVIHLLGDAAFNHMAEDFQMTLMDVMSGLKTVLGSDKQEKYIEYLSDLNSEALIILTKLANYESNELPVQIPFSWVKEEIGVVAKQEKVKKSLVDLQKRGYLLKNSVNQIYQFNDELFRIFLRMRGMQMIEREIGAKGNEDGYDQTEVIPYDETEINDVVKFMAKADINREWATDEFAELLSGDDEFLEGEEYLE